MGGFHKEVRGGTSYCVLAAQEQLKGCMRAQRGCVQHQVWSRHSNEGKRRSACDSLTSVIATLLTLVRSESAAPQQYADLPC
jgi:hypothetical protein